MKKTFLLFLAIFGVLMSVNSQWQLTGNSISSTDFLGTTNGQPLVFKANNQPAGLIDYNSTKANTTLGYLTLASLSTGYNNTAVGYQALYSNTSAFSNDAFGYKALYNNTTGNANSAIGNFTLFANTTGYNNIAMGLYSLVNNTTGAYNVATGFALFNNTTGSRNTAYGFKAIHSNTTVSNLTAMGYQSLYSNTSGTDNTALGYQSLYSNTSGASVTANGHEALYSNTTGSLNAAIGYRSLYSNTTGGSNTANGYDALYTNTTASNNVATGAYALRYNSTGESNTGTGYAALYSNSNGEGNAAHGLFSLYGNTSGNHNTGCGSFSLETNVTGDHNTGVGYQADVNNGGYSNTTVVGYFTFGTASNQVRIGNTNVTSIGGYANWTNISDGRFKRNISENVPGLEFIKQLRAVTYNLDVDAINEFITPASNRDLTGRNISISNKDKTSANQKARMVQSGFIAQEVETAAKKIGFDFSGIDAPKNSKDLYGLRYSDFVVPLVKAVQELSVQNDSLRKENDQLKAQVVNILGRLDILERSTRATIMTSEMSDDIRIPRLEEIRPNPFSVSTIIRYRVPPDANDAFVILSDMNGKALRTIRITEPGRGQVLLNAGSLSSGIYSCTLFVNSKKVDSRQIVLTK
jgi:hypothetical protein